MEKNIGIKEIINDIISLSNNPSKALDDKQKKKKIKNIMKKLKTTSDYVNLLSEITVFIKEGRRTAVKYVNTALVLTYWLIGRQIVEYEQKGKERAEYGKELLKELSKDLNKQFKRGWSEPNLKIIRKFYIAYKDIEKRYTLCTESSEFKKNLNQSNKSDTLTQNQILSNIEMFNTLFPLSWSHYRLLMRLDEEYKKEFYEVEAIRGNWSVRQLDRQIQSMLYERTALSKRKMSVIENAHKTPLILKPEDEIKDPYILEFLGLRDEYSETQLEEALIKHLQYFFLELGRGFAFIGRQKRFTIEGKHYYIDLLLYHRGLRCLVAIDLKIGEFNHSDAGQMNFYLNYLKDKEKLPEENDPVGIILCSDKKETIIEYALGGLDNKIFASKYKLQLPEPEILKAEIENERYRLIEKNIIKN